MPYITEAHLESELSYDITASTQPTSTEVTDIIADIQAEVEGRLFAAGVSVSGLDEITTPVAWRGVKQINLWGAASRLIASAGGLVRTQTGKEENYWNRYQERLAAIAEDPRILGSDTPFATGSDALEFSYITSDDDEYYGPVFRTRDEF